jgi:hypothetical protein
MAQKNTYYVLKVKGKAKIPDYIQVRDASFTLIGYFRPGRSLKHSTQEDADPIFAHIEALTNNLPFGVVTKLEI